MADQQIQRERIRVTAIGPSSVRNTWGGVKWLTNNILIQKKRIRVTADGLKHLGWHQVADQQN